MAVIVNHFNAQILPSGFLGVDIFFVISGFVVTSSLIRQDKQNWKSFLLFFYSKRIKRLLPALISCIIVTTLVGYLFISPSEISYSASWSTGIAALAGISNLYLLNQETNYFGQGAELNLFTQTWSLGVEEQFYIIFPILLILCSLLRTKKAGDYASALVVVLILSIISFLYYSDLSKTNTSAAFFLMPARFWELGAGCFIILFRNSYQAPQSREYPKGIIALLSIAVLIGMLFVSKDFQAHSRIIIVICTAVLLWTFDKTTRSMSMLFYKWIVRIGLLSYSLYLWHWSVLVISRWTIGITKWTIPIQGALIFILAILSYSWIENPFRRSQWPRKKSDVIIFGIITLLVTSAFLFYVGNNLKGYLFTGKESIKVAGVWSLSDSWTHKDKIVWTAEKCTLQNDEDIGKRISFSDCSFGDWQSATTRYLAIGDSSSAAEIAMLKSLHDDDVNSSVTITSSWGASPVRGILNTSSWSGTNTYYWEDVIPELLTHLRDGDVLLIIDNVNNYSPVKQTEKSRNKILTLIERLEQFTQDLDQKGIGIIFQTGTPFIKDANCTPLSSAQWFNLTCNYLSKSASLSRRAPLHNALLDLQERYQNFYVLDIFHDLCPGSVCKYTTDDGVYLFRDKYAHPSVEGSKLASESLLQAVHELKGRL
ncbi:acyltransferase [Leptolyngbya cf. ectocarpi LEGE 11479]|uniref:Acyltransferase n=2 Tax=Leptolyngbya ectocarpi TaxID=1202 RepID=A0A928ZSQ9_LEPEC|nr:acyltransferase [Leptolyngbya cf. ectocarpi LEGE 11479]